ncbi:MAG: hypothetical protein QOC81_311 [Thermoanaerobaculia bacterium]|jgi:hypothetical protein|nr:hypothetical protein [Thermoanaerobaculia bacterium]
MCGICGTTARPGEVVRIEILEAMALTLRHRGPDDQGVWRAPDGRAGFGHRRLCDWGRFFRDVLGASKHFGQTVVRRLLEGQERGLVNSHRIFALTMFVLWLRE